MKLMREIKVEADHFEIGDRIRVKLPNENHTATAIKDESDGMLFLLDDYLDEARPMNKNDRTDGGYEKSDMRVYLQKVANAFPKKLKKRMVCFDNGDYLRLLTLSEMCGKNEYFDYCDGQILWMEQDRRHRIALRKKNSHEWGWLATMVSSEEFAIISYYGEGSADYASNLLGVRPAFKLKL